jgi:hypothetical protein
MHGLRKGCLRILAEAGCNILELQSRSGHLTLSELQKYISRPTSVLPQIARQRRSSSTRRSKKPSGKSRA